MVVRCLWCMVLVIGGGRVVSVVPNDCEWSCGVCD